MHINKGNPLFAREPTRNSRGTHQRGLSFNIVYYSFLRTLVCGLFIGPFFFLVPTQYRQLCRLPKTRLIRGIYYMAKPVLGKSVRSDWFLLGRDFARRTVSMETVQDVYFCLGVKPATSKFAITTAKKKVWTLSFFIAKLPEKAKKIEILLSFQRWMKKTNILRASSVLS